MSRDPYLKVNILEILDSTAKNITAVDIQNSLSHKATIGTITGILAEAENANQPLAKMNGFALTAKGILSKKKLYHRTTRTKYFVRANKPKITFEEIDGILWEWHNKVKSKRCIDCGESRRLYLYESYEREGWFYYRGKCHICKRREVRTRWQNDPDFRKRSDTSAHRYLHRIIENLEEPYVKKILYDQTGIPINDIMEEMVAEKKAQIALNRYIYRKTGRKVSDTIK